MVFVFLVAKAAKGMSGPFGRALEWRPLTYLGKISYGVYLLHLFVSNEIHRLANKFIDTHGSHFAIPLFFSYLAVTLFLAGLSWRFLEAPLNDLKRLFPYRRPAS